MLKMRLELLFSNLFSMAYFVIYLPIKNLFSRDKFLVGFAFVP